MVLLHYEVRSRCVSCRCFSYVCPHVSCTPPLPPPRPLHIKAMFQEEQIRHYSQCSHRKLVNAAPQRWCSVSNVLEAVIVNRATIDGVYGKEGKDSPLAAYMDEIVELYSLIKPAAELIVECQQTRFPTGQAAVLGLAALKLSTFDVNSPLDIRTPARKLAQGGTGGAGGGEQRASGVPKEHAELTTVSRLAREHLHRAVDRRWFRKRYDSPDSENTDFVFDMQMALHPTTAGLEYVDRLASTPQHAATVKKTITDNVISLAVELAQDEAERRAEGTRDDQREPAAKRARSSSSRAVHPMFARPGNKKQVATTARFVSLGLFKAGGGVPEGPSIEDKARTELKTLRGVEAGTLTADLSCDSVLQWWKRWESSYPLLARVVRVVFGAPASAAVLERDLSDAGRMMTSSRSTAYAKYVEMILFLHGNLDLIPEDIPELPTDGHNSAEKKIPWRLVNPMPELEGLAGSFDPRT